MYSLKINQCVDFQKEYDLLYHSILWKTGSFLIEVFNFKGNVYHFNLLISYKMQILFVWKIINVCY